MRRGVAVTVLAFVGAMSCSLAHADEAADLTVRLYSTEIVSKVHVVPLHATIRMCATCPPMAATQMDIIWERDGSHLRIGGKRVDRIWLDGQLQMTSDSGKSEAGAGRWQISASSDGLHVILAMPSERYVMAVVSAEAATDEPMESLKALAVTAHSFAMMNPHRHGSEGLCDSTHCQALRMGTIAENVRKAVLETAGETLWFAVRQVPGYFTQNCGGETADAAEVWGGAHKPWLVAHPDSFCRRRPALWHAEITEQQLHDALEAEGFRAPRQLETVRIATKDSSGRAIRVELAGGGQKLLLPAASLRFAIDRGLGWNQIRSDWYTVHVESTRKVVFDGKGYGHGVGLCQAGAAEMAREGKGYREILAFYFSGTKARIAAGDDGWKNFEEQGWSLRSSTAAPALVQAGNAALVKAHELWRGDATMQPIVTLAPSTELFRQISSQPGWELASTSGADITLQPLDVLNRHTQLQTLLLHEFLHSMVESEANAAAPLWLREGLVEVLAGERASASDMQSQQIDEALRNATSLQQAQRAHLAACALVQKLISRYGMANVHGWLRSGVPGGVLAGK